MMTKPRVALFIDAENASARYVTDYLKRCNELGKLTIARCYGGPAGLKRWDKAMAEHHIMPMQTPQGGKKENASDFALTIDAVSLLHRGLFDHAVVVSSDVDFTQLAIHIRENGKGVDGIGEGKSKEFLRSAFDRFVIVPAAPQKKTPAAKAMPQPVKKIAPIEPVKKRNTQPEIDRALLRKVFITVSKDGKSADVLALGRNLAVDYPKYKKGYRTLENFLRKSGMFELKDGIATLLAN